MFNLKINRKYLVSGVLVAAIVIGSLVASVQQATLATGRGSADQAITLAAESPMFQNVLAAREGWTAAAFDSGNSYGIWRVQFWDADGEDLGYADVRLTNRRIYSWESNVGATESQKQDVREALLNFLAGEPDVQEMVGDVREYDIWIDYNGWINTWFVFINKGGLDSLYVGIQNNSDDPLDMDALTLYGIYFPEMPTYTEWEGAQKSQAVALAFANAEIAAAVREHDGWVTETTRAGDATWIVTFKVGDAVLATATVDLVAREVSDIQITGA
jgi:hypothetical protein